MGTVKIPVPQVDLHTPDFLSLHFRDEVLTNAQVQYAQS